MARVRNCYSASDLTYSRWPDCECSLPEILSLGKNLKILRFRKAFGAVDKLLVAILALPKLDELDLIEGTIHGYKPLHLNSEESLKSLSTGPVRRSLVTCTILLTERTTIDGRDQSQLRCFKEDVEPSFERRAIGNRELEYRQRSIAETSITFVRYR